MINEVPAELISSHAHQSFGNRWRILRYGSNNGTIASK